MSNIIDAVFQTVWSEGEIETNCKLNLETGEIFDIESSDDGVEFEQLIDSFLIVENNLYWINCYHDEFDFALDKEILEELVSNLPNENV